MSSMGKQLEAALESNRKLRNELEATRTADFPLRAELAEERARNERLQAKLEAAYSELAAYRLLMEGAMRLYLATGKAS